MRIFISILTVSVLFLAGCSSPEVVKLSPDTYMIYDVDKGGMFGNAANMQAKVIATANKFAESQGRVAVPVSSNSTPMSERQNATFQYQFRVVDKDDPEYARVSLVPRADLTTDEDIDIDIDLDDEMNSGKEKDTDIYNELIKLEDLRQRGILTDAEFQTQKEKVLNE